jgi:hypothetical protein
MAGYEMVGNTEVAKYWKNGASVSLTDGTLSSHGNSIFLSGN